MQVRTYGDWQAFAASAAPVLEGDEAGHCIVYTILESLREPREGQRRPWLAVVSASGEGPRAVAAMLPPNPLVLSPLMPPEALPLLAGQLVAEGRADEVDIVVGTPDVASGFAQACRELTGRAGRVQVHMRLHRIDAAPDVPATSGSFSAMRADDVDLVARWFEEFTAEAWGERFDAARAVPEMRSRVDAAAKGMALWRDGGVPVSMAGYGGMTPTGARIGPVYTPPSLRGHGYASGLTAALTRQLFERGRRGCFLFTDTANRTSNAIYAAIGYRPVADFVRMQIDRTAG
jgi:predicted GNAT family acetyltransferase